MNQSNMQNVFVFSSPYIIRTILYDMAFVFNKPIQTVYILSEIVNQSETFDLLNIPNIVVVTTLEEGLSLCDSVIIIREELMCLQTIDFILNYTASNGIYCLDLPYPFERTVVVDENEENCRNDNESPAILVIENGDYAQTYYTETLLMHELLHNKLKIRFRLSTFTEKIYSALQRSMCLNPALQSMAQEEADILVYTVQKKPFVHTDISNLIRTIDFYKPDFIIMTTNNEFVQSNELNRWFDIIYGQRLNILIKSQYILVKRTDTIGFPLYRTSHTNEPYNCIEQHNSFVHKLLAAISIPDGVSAISLTN